MSKGRKNNHYHYAEKFEDRSRRSSSGKRPLIPFKSVIISLVVLLMFGFICTTFSVYVTDNVPDGSEEQTLLMQVRNTKAAHDIAFSGAEADLASTGSDWMEMKGGGVFIFDNTNTGWSSVQLVIGRQYSYGNAGIYCRIESMTKITGTNLYSYTIDNWATSGDDIKIYNVRFVTGSNYNTGSFSPTDSGFLASCTHYTASFRQDDYVFDKGDVYHCYAASSSDGAALSCHYRSAGYSYFNHNQTIRSYTKNANTSGSYNQINDGGTISGSSKKLNGNASSTNSSEGDGKVIAAKTATVTLKANVSSGYRFVGWYDSSNNALSNGVGGYTIGVGSDSKPYISYTCTGAVEIRARFIKTYTVTVEDMSGYTGTAATGSGTVDIGGTITAAATTPQGVSFTGWTLSSGATYNTVTGSASATTWSLSPTSNFTMTAGYSLAAPTNLNLTYESYKVVGYTDTYAPTDHSAQTATASGSGSVLSYSYSIAKHSSNTLAGAGTFSINASTGAVTASVPGKYVVTMTVQDSCYGLTSSATTTATVEIRPASPAFTYVVQGYTGGVVEGITGTNPSARYKIPINNATPSTSDFQVASYMDDNDVIANYVYTWSMTDGTSTATYNNTTNVRKIDRAADSGTVLHDRPAGDYSYTVTLAAAYNGVSSTTSVTIYYAVVNDFLDTKHFNFDNTYDNPETDIDESQTVQKIYAVDNAVTQIYAAFNAGGTTFDTILFFSGDNKSFTPIQIFTDQPFTMDGKQWPAQPNDVAHQTVSPYTTGTYNYLLFNLPVVAQRATNGTAINETVNVMQRSGVKYFKAYVDDFLNSNVIAAKPVLHTTVGTSSSAGARPIYFKDSNTYTDTRLMAFFLNSSGEMTYQTAADYNHVVTQIDNTRSDRSGISRFYVPSDAVSVYFAYASTESYVLPTVNDGTLSFGTDSTVFPAHTGLIEIDSDHNMYKVSSREADGNGIYAYTGAWTNLDMDS